MDLLFPFGDTILTRGQYAAGAWRGTSRRRQVAAGAGARGRGQAGRAVWGAVGGWPWCRYTECVCSSARPNNNVARGRQPGGSLAGHGLLRARHRRVHHWLAGRGAAGHQSSPVITHTSGEARRALWVSARACGIQRGMRAPPWAARALRARRGQQPGSVRVCGRSAGRWRGRRGRRVCARTSGVVGRRASNATGRRTGMAITLRTEPSWMLPPAIS